MTVQTKPKTTATKHCPNALQGMEPLVRNVSRVASVLICMSTSESMIQGEELGWVGDQLFQLGRELEELYYKAGRDAGTGTDGGRPQ